MTIGLISIVFYIYGGLSGTTWGGWTPPSTEIKLTKKEFSWKKQIRSTYECDFNYIGLDGGFREDSITYIDIEFGDNSVLLEILDKEIESVTKKIAESFVAATSGKRKQTYVLISYEHNHDFKNDTVIMNLSKRRSCLYDILHKKTLPTTKKLIVPKLGYFGFSEKENDLFYYKLGGSMRSYLNCTIQQDSILKYYKIKERIKLKDLDNCISYSSRTKQLIDFQNSNIESTHTFVFYENKCISVDINYTYHPKSKDVRPIDFIKKVTEIAPDRLKNAKPDKLMLINKIKEENYNLNKNMFGFHIQFNVDTLKKPWRIKYKTSLDDFRYYSTYEM